MGHDSPLDSLIRRLNMKPIKRATENELLSIERLSGIELPHLFRMFQLTIGECECDCVLGMDPEKGREVIFFSIDEILSRLEELQEYGLIPFADDLWGNVFYLRASSKEEINVVLFDDELESFIPIADNFFDFLDRLRLEE